MRYRNMDTMERLKAEAENFVLTQKRSPTTTELANLVGCSRSSAYRYLLEMDERGMLSYDGTNILTDKIKKITFSTITAPVLGAISCGTPLDEEEAVEQYLTLPTSIFGEDDSFILRASGDSMVDVGIADGDLVVVRRQKEAQDGDIVVALVGTETTLKRLLLDSETGRVCLHPENKTMSDLYPTDCAIQGVATKVIKSL